MLSLLGYLFVGHPDRRFVVCFKILLIQNFYVYRGPSGYDRTRNAVIGNKDFELTYLEEAYTTEHWLVRIYRVKKPFEFNRPSLKAKDRLIPPTNFISRKVFIFYNFKSGIHLF